jgi:signal transduction histidine kinase
VSVVLLSWFGYRAIAEWRNSAFLLAEERSSEAADLLLTALTRDMSGAQESILSSPEWAQFDNRRPHELDDVAASAFARYPYPESFFAWREGHDVVFFNRSNREPRWETVTADQGRFPVSINRAPPIGDSILTRISFDAGRGRRLSVFDLPFDGVTYQIVALLTYSDEFREHLSAADGFTVNLGWVNRYYYSDLAKQTWAVGPGPEEGLVLSITDDRGALIAGSAINDTTRLTHHRRFKPFFFNPDFEASAFQELAREPWTITVSALGDQTLSRAMALANRILLFGTAAGLTLVAGILLIARAERRAEQVAQLRSDFVSSVSHELKTPISTIRTAAATLSRARLSGMSVQSCGRIVTMEARRLDRLVENLLAYSRVTDVANIYSFEPLEVAIVFNDIQQNFESQLDQGGFELEMRIAHGVPFVLGDRLALRLLFDNLVDNAIKYSDKGRTLLLTAVAEGKEVKIDVVDAGVGIALEEIPFVTRKFVRGRDTGAAGSGLGLAIASRIAEDHGGKLRIRSVPGDGTTVEVRLPIA